MSTIGDKIIKAEAMQRENKNIQLLNKSINILSKEIDSLKNQAPESLISCFSYVNKVKKSLEANKIK